VSAAPSEIAGLARLLAARRLLMAEKHVISALIERRARLAGELREKQLEVKRMQKALASIDLCIRIFKTDYDPGSIAPKVTFEKSPAALPKGVGDPSRNRRSLYRTRFGHA
jgi:hypothetical protein